jgi:ferredoxin-NADP reductase
MESFSLNLRVSSEGGPRLDAALLTARLGDPRAYDYFICASERVRKETVKTLRALGVRRSRIHFDSFNFG